MPKRVPLSVSLTDELAGFVAGGVGSGRRGSAGEVVRTGPRPLGDKGDGRSASVREGGRRPR